MRVVAGTARGRRLVAPVGRDVRPTLDRVREALFNSLGSLGGQDPTSVLDLFAGSGALGVEALSRGAGRVTFVDDAASSLAAVRANLAATGLGDRSDVVRGDALRLLDGAERRLPGPYDLVLLDPPYAFDDWGVLVSRIALVLATHAIVVAESDRSLQQELRSIPTLDVSILRERRYGGTVVTMMSIQAPTTGAPVGERDPEVGHG